MDILKYGKAICYSGYRLGQSPSTEVPTKAQIEEDLKILMNEGYDYIRMYDPNLHARRVLEVIREQKLPIRCLIGIDSYPEVNNLNCLFEKQDRTPEELEANIKRNDAEEDKLIELVREYDEEVIAVSIGNENTPEWGAHMVPVERLMKHAKRFKEELDKPVTFCEGAFEWMKLKELGDYLDFICIHSYPLHYRETIDVAVETNKRQYREVKELFGDKQVLFTEVGWTTKPNDNMIVGQANVENQKRYLTELNEWIEKDQIIAFIFEAFDEPWKGSRPESSECNWGIYDVNRKRKW